MGTKVVIVVAVALLLLAPLLAAHDTEDVGDYVLEFGWRTEPPHSGIPNAFEVVVTTSSGDPADAPDALLTVDIRFGDQTRSFALTANGNGRFAAIVVPTRAGIYEVHVSGRIDETIVDIESTCGATTFDCVADVTEVEIPGSGVDDDELAARVDREVDRLNARIDDGTGVDVFDLAAVAALATGISAIVLGWLGRRRGR